MYLTKTAAINLPGSYSKEQSKWIHSYINEDKSTSVDDTLKLFTDEKQLKDAIKILSFYGGGTDVLAGLSFLLKNKAYGYGNPVLPKSLSADQPAAAYQELNKSLAWVYSEMLKLLNLTKSGAKFNVKLFNDLIHFNTLLHSAKLYIQQKDKHKTPVPAIEVQQKSLLSQLKEDPAYKKNYLIGDIILTDDDFAQTQLDEILDNIKASVTSIDIYEFIPGWVNKPIEYMDPESQELCNSYQAKIFKAMKDNTITLFTSSVLEDKVSFENLEELRVYIVRKSARANKALAEAILTPNPDLKAIKTAAKEKVKWFTVSHFMSDYAKFFTQTPTVNVPFFKFYSKDTFSLNAQDIIENAYVNKSDAPLSTLTVDEKVSAVDYLKQLFEAKIETSSANAFYQSFQILVAALETTYNVYLPTLSNVPSLQTTAELMTKVMTDAKKLREEATLVFHKEFSSQHLAQRIKKSMTAYVVLTQLSNQLNNISASLDKLFKQTKKNFDPSTFFMTEYMRYPEVLASFPNVKPVQLAHKNVNVVAPTIPQMTEILDDYLYYGFFTNTKEDLENAYSEELNAFDMQRVKTILQQLLDKAYIKIGEDLKNFFSEKIDYAQQYGNIAESTKQSISKQHYLLSKKLVQLHHFMLDFPSFEDDQLMLLMNQYINATSTVLKKQMYATDTKEKLVQLFSQQPSQSFSMVDIHETPTKSVRIYKDDEFLGEYKYLYAYKFIKGLLSNNSDFSSKLFGDSAGYLVSQYVNEAYSLYTHTTPAKAMKELMDTDNIQRFLKSKSKHKALPVKLTEDAEEFMDKLEKEKKL